ncbi:Helix-turn-helix domain-containing protein [Candidatus Hepatincolaceae symbiont of Richtersius coronifer]
MSTIFIYIKEPLAQQKISQYLATYFNDCKIENFSPNCQLAAWDILVVEDKVISNEIMSLPGRLVILANNLYLADDIKYAKSTILYLPVKLSVLQQTLKNIINKLFNNLVVEDIALDCTISNGFIYFKSDKKAALELTLKESELLRQLFIYYPHSVSKKTLLEEVWQLTAEGIDTQTVESHLSLIRKKILPLNLVIEKDLTGYKLVKQK